MGQATVEITEYLKELETLVNIDSVSSEPTGTGKIAAFLRTKYESLGWKIEARAFDASIGPCLEITNCETDAYDVLILGHMDTVFPLGTAAQRPYSEKDGRAYGPGVIDCKAGLLSGFYVLRALAAAGKLAGKSVCVFLNSDHEGISSKYSRAHSEALARRSRCTLVLEAARANGNLVHKRKGIGRYTIQIAGVAAHAGIDHEKGRNAIEELAHWVVALQDHTDYEREITLNIGKISGGTSVAAVPDKAVAELDIRFYDAAEAVKVEAMLRDFKEHPHVAGTLAQVTGGVSRPPMVPTDRTQRLCAAIDGIARELGLSFGWTASGGGSDGSFSAAVGTPTIDGLGPVGGAAHSADEYLEIDTVLPRMELLRQTVCYVLEHEI